MVLESSDLAENFFVSLFYHSYWKNYLFLFIFDISTFLANPNTRVYTKRKQTCVCLVPHNIMHKFCHVRTHLFKCLFVLVAYYHLLSLNLKIVPLVAEIFPQ